MQAPMGPRKRRCVATRGCSYCSFSPTRICTNCAFETYFSDKKERDMVLHMYTPEYINILKGELGNTDRETWEQSLGYLHYECSARTKHPVKGCLGLMQDLEVKLLQKKDELNELYREKAIAEADLTPIGFVNFYQDRNIPLDSDQPDYIDLGPMF